MSDEVPYSPEPLKRVTLKRMKEIVAKHSTPQDPALAGLSSEIWLVWKLRGAGAEWRYLDTGVTTKEQRRERIRAEIKRCHLEHRNCGKRNGKLLDFSAVFGLIYGQSL